MNVLVVEVLVSYQRPCGTMGPRRTGGEGQELWPTWSSHYFLANSLRLLGFDRKEEPETAPSFLLIFRPSGILT